jgi:hypothetical protein
MMMMMMMMTAGAVDYYRHLLKPEHTSVARISVTLTDTYELETASKKLQSYATVD